MISERSETDLWSTRAAARVSVKIHFAKKIEARRASTATAQGIALGNVLYKLLQPVGLLYILAALQAAIF